MTPYLFKIRIKLFDDFLGFSFTKVLLDPFIGISIVLGKIAGYTGWQNIFFRVFAALAHWDKVFLVKNARIIPQLGWISTVCTYTMKILQGFFPVLVSKSCAYLPFSVFTDMPVSPYSVRMRFSPAPNVEFPFFAILLAISPLILSNFIWIILLPLFCSCVANIAVPLVPTSIRFFAVFWMVFSPLTAIYGVTSPAPRVKSSFANSPRKVFGGFGQILSASYAELKWEWLINHLRTSFAGFAIGDVDEAAKLAVRAVHEAALVHGSKYIAGWRFVQ